MTLMLKILPSLVSQARFLVGGLLTALVSALLMGGSLALAQPAYEFPDYIKASNTDAGDEFGGAIAADGDTLVVAARFESSAGTGVGADQQDNSASWSGAVYVYVRDDSGQWTQQAYLKPSNAQAHDRFGSTVAISGDTIVVGAELEDSSASVVNGDQEDNAFNGAGAAYVFVRNEGQWEQQAYLKASNPDILDGFGAAVAIHNDTIVVGANAEDSFASGVNGNEFDNTVTNSGAAYVFVRSGDSWVQQAYLKASNTGSEDQFGSAVSIYGDRIAVGAANEDSDGIGVDGQQLNDDAENAGAVYLFERSGTVWSQVAYIKASNAEAFDIFGWSLSMHADKLLVGAIGEDGLSTGVGGDELDNSARSAGAAYLFSFDGTAWTQQAYIKASNTDFYLGGFGVSVHLQGDRMIVGSSTDDSATVGVDGNQDDDSAQYSGAAYVFEQSAGSWRQIAYLKASNTDEIDYFGSSVAITEGFAAAAAGWEDGGDSGFNANADDNSAENAGAVYVYSAVPSFSIGGSISGLVGPELELTLNGQERLSPVEDGDFGFQARLSDGEVYSIEISAHPTEPPQFCRLTNASGAISGSNVDNVLINCDPPAPLPGFVLDDYIKASNTDQGDEFGFALAVDQDTLVVSAPSEASVLTGIGGPQTDNSAFGAGAVYVYLRDDSGAWVFDRYIKASNTSAGDNFGSSLALSGDTLAVGAPGEDSAATGFNGNQFDDTQPDAGAVYIYLRDGNGDWFPEAYLKASNTDTGDQFGASVGLSGDTLIVGAPGEDSSGSGVDSNQIDNAASDAGAAYVFTRTGVTWSQQAYLKPVNIDAEDQFGYSVDIEGERVIVGSPLEDGGDASGGNGQATAGAAYIFERAGSDWSQAAYLKPLMPETGDFFGWDVAIDGRLAAVGARLDDGPNDALEDSGAAYVFERHDAGWALEQALYASNADIDDRLGWAVDIEASQVVVTARAEASASLGVDGNPADNSLPFAGAAYVFRRNQKQWQQAHYIKGLITDELDLFGEAVGISGGVIAVGAKSEDSNAQGVGGVASDNSALSSGAVYVYGTDSYKLGGTVSGLVGSGLSLRVNGEEVLAITNNGDFEFDQALLAGAYYQVEIVSLPDSPEQSCEITNAEGYMLAQDINSIQIACSSAFRIGGQVSGAAGPGLVLRNNNTDELAVSSNGTFIFPTRVGIGESYEVTVAGTPSSPRQRCRVLNGSGVVQSQNVTDVLVQCETVYVIKGEVLGLAGGTLVLQNNDGDRLSVSGDGHFQFSQSLPAGANYDVSVRRNPQLPAQRCEVANASGTVPGADVADIEVTCTSGYRIGGTVSGVEGPGVVLSNNGGDPFPIAQNGPFQLNNLVLDGSTYNVIIEATSDIPPQTCAIENPSGTIQGQDVDNIQVNCETGYRLGGEASGVQGTGLVISNNSGDELAIDSNGSFIFDERLFSGEGYNVIVESQPSSPDQICEINNGLGDISVEDVIDVLVECRLARRVSGSVTGLEGTGLLLKLNDTSSLPITGNGPFQFAELVADGSDYIVVVQNQPASPDQICDVINDSGTASGSDVTNVAIECRRAQVNAGQIQFTTAAVTAQESDGLLRLTLERVAGADGEVTVRVSSENGTAQAGQDFRALDVQRSWSDGDSSEKSVDVELIADAEEETSEQFTVRVQITSGAASLGTNAVVQITLSTAGDRLFSDRFEVQ